MATIWCPKHRKHEAFEAPVVQPHTELAVRYPCGFTDTSDVLPIVVRQIAAPVEQDVEEQMKPVWEAIRALRAQRQPQHAPNPPKVSGVDL